MSETITVNIELIVEVNEDWDNEHEAALDADFVRRMVENKAQETFTEADGITVMEVSATPDIDDHLDEWAEREALEQRVMELEMRKTKSEVGE